MLSKDLNAPERGTRLLLVGPMPPPIHGQSIVMSHLADTLGPMFPRLEMIDTGEGSHEAVGRMVKLRRSSAAFAAVRNADVVYVAVKAGNGMWLTTALALAARLSGARMFLHHHSYAYVRERKLRMLALAKGAGPDAVHIVLADSMAEQLHRVMPEIVRLFVLGNAGLIDKSLLNVPVKVDSTELVLGHMSDLTMEKGIDRVVDLAVALNEAGAPVRLVVGGPQPEGAAAEHLRRASNELGQRYDYRGLLTGESKHRFFSDITHFVFPSRYAHEAVPLVLYEAMAAGAFCVATRQGAIPEQVQDAPCVLTEDADSFIDEALPILARSSVSSEESQRSKDAYRAALAQSESQLATLVDLFGESQLKSQFHTD